MEKLEAYAAIRKNAEHEFIDINSLSCHLPSAENKARNGDMKMSHWANDNPIVRFAAVIITEV